MTKGLQIIKENKNLAEWSRQVEECRGSGLSVRAWCEQSGIAVSTYTYRQNKVWKALNQQKTFVEMPTEVLGESESGIAATVRIRGANAEIHNGADEATLTAIFRALKSC